MDGVHDMGGMHGFGPVPVEIDEPLFHEPWEGRVCEMLPVVLSRTTTDRFRFTIERMPPAAYLASSYYERWLWAIERLAEEQGLLTSTDRPPPVPRPSPSLPIWSGRFQPGDAVRVRNAVTDGPHAGSPVSAAPDRPGGAGCLRLAEPRRFCGDGSLRRARTGVHGRL